MWIDKTITFLAVRQDIWPSELDRSGVRVDSLGKKEEICSVITWTLFPTPRTCVAGTCLNPCGSVREWQSCPVSQTLSTQKGQVERVRDKFQKLSIMTKWCGRESEHYWGAVLGVRSWGEKKNGLFTPCAWIRVKS